MVDHTQTDIHSQLELTPRAIRRRLVIRWFVTLFGLAMAIGVGVVAARSMRGESPTQYQTEAVRRDQLTVKVTATGELESLTQVKVGTEISGVVERVDVDFNSHVEVGQVLAKVNTDKLEAQAGQARAALQSAQADVTNAEAGVDDTKRSFERAQALFDRNLLARSDRDSAEAAYRKAEAARVSSVAHVDEAKANLSAIETDLKKSYIRSPIKGIVLDRQIDPGQTVAASFQTPVLFTLSEDLTRMKLSVDVDEADIGSVRPGQAATFRVEAYPTREFNSRVVEVHSTPKTSNGVVTYETILTVDNSQRLLQPGMTVTADITVTTVDNALLVPNAALRFTPPATRPATRGFSLLPPPPGSNVRRAPQQPKGRSRLWVLDGHVPRPVDVLTGPTDGKVTVVTPTGEDLTIGDDAIVDIATTAVPQNP